MIKKLLIGFLVLFVITFCIVIVPLIFYVSAFGIFDKDYSVTDLKRNFTKNEMEIHALTSYYNHVVPFDKEIGIEFKNRKEIERLEITSSKTHNSKIPSQTLTYWDLKVKSHEFDSIIKSIGWTSGTIDSISKRLKKANCIGIKNGEPTIVNFQRSGLGMYSFNIFKEPISGKIKEQYNDSCRYIFVNQYLVLEYGGGVVGPQCFYLLK